MSIYTIERQLFVKQPLAKVFDFFSRAENLEKITPPWMHFRIRTPLPIEMKKGTNIQYSLRVRGIPMRWLTIIDEWNPPYSFVDVQAKGPYKLWRHIHTFKELEGGTAIMDVVRYELPFGPLGNLVHALQVKGDVQQIFEYRSKQVPALLL